MNKKNFIKENLTYLAGTLDGKLDEFVSDFVSMSADSRFTRENAYLIAEYLINPANHKIGSTEVAPGIKVNIDWTALKEKEEVFPEVHHRFHDIHIPTFREGMFISSASENLPVHEAFDEDRDIGFYEKPEGAFAGLITPNSWKFIPKNVFHGPLYGGFEHHPENYFLEDGKKKVVKICIKILAD